MTQRITVGFTGADFPTLSAALGSLSGFLVEPVVIEVHASTPPEAVVIPDTILPTAANPLVMMSLRQPSVASPFSDVQLISGSESLYPAPQPRLTKAQMTSLTVNATFTTVDGFEILGDVTVGANDGVVVHGCRLAGGRILVVRTATVPVNCRISSCEVVKTSAQSAIKAEKVTSLFLYHNTVFIRRSDAANTAVDSWALEVSDAQVTAENNLFAAAGQNASSVRFSGTPTGSVFARNFYASFDGARRFHFGSTRTNDLGQWAQFMTSETGSLFGDPLFRDRAAATPDVDIANGSKAVAAAPALASVRTDVRGERRPVDFATMGAHEHAEIVTESGKKRFLELLSGLSTDPVTMAVLGKSGSPASIHEFAARDPGDTFDPLFTSVQIEGAVAPGAAGQEGLVVFRPAFQVTTPIYGELLDNVFDRADEVGLLSSDGTVFLIKRMHSVPFDATGFMHTQFEIPVELVA